MVDETLTRMREMIPSKVEYLLTRTREKIPLAELKLGKEYSTEDNKAVWVAEESDGSRRLDFKLGDSVFSGHYTKSGMLHGVVYFDLGDKHASHKGLGFALNGSLCGRIIIETPAYHYTVLIHEDTNTHITTLKEGARNVSKVGMTQKRERVYLGEAHGYYETYSTDTGTMVKLVSYLDGVRHGVQGSWFKSGTPRKMMSLSHDQGHGDYIVYHPDGEPSQHGSAFMGEKFGEWKIWAVGAGSTPNENHSVIYKPKLPLDWMKVMLDEHGLMKTTDPNKPNTKIIRHSSIGANRVAGRKPHILIGAPTTVPF